MFSLRHRSKRARQGLGMSLVEVAASLAIAGIAMSGLMQISADTNNSLRDTSAGNRLMEVQTAAQQYLKANGTALAAAVPVGGRIVIPVGRTTPSGAIPTGPSGLPSLQGGGFLASTFVDSNSYRQQHAMIVRQPTAGKIEVLVTTIGGLAVPDGDLGRIASKVGAGGGVVLQKPPAYALGTIQGVGGGWSDTTSTWTTSGVGPTPGHAVATLYFNASSTTSDYLNRYNTGIPEANRMHTNIDLNGFNLNNTNLLDTKTIKNSATGGSVTLTSPVVATTGVTITGGLTMPAGSSIGFQGQNLLMWTTYNRTLGYVAATDSLTTNQLTGFTTAGTMNADTLRARAFYDNGNSNYLVAPSGNTKLNNLISGATSTGALSTTGSNHTTGNLQVDGSANITGGVYANGGFTTVVTSNMATINMRAYSSLVWIDTGRGFTDNYANGYLETTGSAPLWIHSWLNVDGKFYVAGQSDLWGPVIVHGNTLTVTPPSSGPAISTTGYISANGVLSTGALATGQTASIGAACSLAGSIARSSATPLWCDGTTWHSMQVN